MPWGLMNSSFSPQRAIFWGMLVTAMGPMAALAAPASCGPDKPVVLELQRVDEHERIDHSKSKKEIQRMVDRAKTVGQFVEGTASSNSRGESWSSVGLTHASFEVQSQSETEIRQISEQQVCGRFINVTLLLGFKEQVIYIPREYAEGSCPYSVVLSHEREHVSINRNALSEYLPQIRQDAQHELSSVGPIFASDQATLSKKMNQYLGRALGPLFDSMEAAKNARNRDLDSADHYREIQQQCPSW